MEWTQLIIFFIGVFGLFIWNRSESRSDIRHMDNRLEATRSLIQEIRNEGIQFREELRCFREAMNNETKDFHHRLLEIERNRK